MNLFNSNPAELPSRAFDEAPSEAGPASPRTKKVDRRAMRHDSAIRRAYQRGRRDERARRRGSPFVNAILLLTACAGVFVAALAIYGGSFTRGGQILDQKIAASSASASQAVRKATANAGEAVQNAGYHLKRSASGQG